jgi:hypothetical protein
MIYFAGERLDWRDPENWNSQPIVVRGYDASGNLLSIIRADFLTVTVSTSGTGYDLSAYTKSGSLVSIRHNPSNGYQLCYPGALAASTDGHLYWASGPFWAYVNGTTWTGDLVLDFFRVYNRNGDRVPFPQLHGSLIRAVKLDSGGNIIVGGEFNGALFYTLRKYDSSGSLLWSVATGNVVLDIAIDSSDNVYVASTSFVAKYNSSGAQQWSKALSYGDIAYTIAVDASYVYDSGYFNTGKIEKRNIGDGEIVATVITDNDNRITLLGSTIYSVEFDSFSSTCYKKFDTSLNLLSTINYETPDASTFVGRDCFSGKPGVDVNGNVYFCGNRRLISGIGSVGNLFHFYSLTSTNTKRWETLSATMLPGIRWDTGVVRTDAEYLTYDYVTAYGGDAGPDLCTIPIGGNWEFWRGCSTVIVIEDTKLPGLALPVSLGIPTWTGDTYTDVAGLSLPLYIGNITTIRDYVGALPLPDVYRLYLTGTPTIELPLSSIQCRRNIEKLSVTLIVPSLTSTLISAIEARRAGNIIVVRGKKFPDGTEQLDEMVNTGLSSLRYDIGTGSASATLNGNIASAISSKIRAIRGISYRNTINQLRRVRCAIDTFLLPGDTADLGNGETFVVSELTFNINTDQATMEISE